ncbi:MAG: sphingosine N-acyltransferase lag1 [Icmadophila ericetorum]|nr:sphingosine N-acyltransferase lag1 [Icmadophila ericetorum]
MSSKHISPSRDWSLRKQIEISGCLILPVIAIHTLFPSARPHTKLLYQLPYYEAPGRYSQGFNDVFFVLGWLVLLTNIRAVIIASLYELIRRFRLVPSKARTRFAEQGWLLFYDGISFSMGMYLIVSSSYWLNFRELWVEWPGRYINGQLKWYYLVQLAFWLQQLVSINLEARRKDYTQMLSHHVVTCVLLYATYVYRWTKTGNVVMCIMDVVDFLLPLAKMLKYRGHETACNAAFGLFLTVWVISRHIIYNLLCHSIYRDVPGVMDYGCYSGATGLPQDPNTLGVWRYVAPFLDQSSTICLDKKIKWTFLGMLIVIQSLSLLWFSMIARVAYQIVRDGEGKDVRSSDEEESEVECEVEQPKLHEEKAGSSSGNLQASDTAAIRGGFFQRRRGRIRIPGSRERKEIIGRVGCKDKI